MDEIPCPFVYANGKRCVGHITRVEIYKSDLSWAPTDDCRWELQIRRARSHFHLFCSEKGNHAGTLRRDDARLKLYWDQLPEALRQKLAP